jgi:hypothetical protein
VEGEDPNLERTEDPHVTIMWKAKSWRYNIRRTGFMDREPDPKEVPEEVVAHIGKKLTEGIFVIDLPAPRKGRASARSVGKATKRAAKTAKTASMGARRARSLQIAGRRIRSERALKSVFLEERGARRPSLFVSSTATHLAALAGVAHQERGNLRLFLFEQVSPERREYLQTLFRTVVSVGGDVHLLRSDELAEVLSADTRGDHFVGGAVNPVEEVVVLYRGSFDRLSVPLTWFQRISDAQPDFADFEVIDYGQTVRFGEFEVATDAILYDFDPEYRSRARKRQLELDGSFGGSLRRLRELRGVRRSDFPSISAKEIARIERGEVKRPREETVKAIAKHLGVSPEELPTY